jgi:hypothetical protein
MNAKNAWFKHYNTSHDGQTMAELWAENDTEAIAFYWVVLEMISRWETPESRGVLVGNLSIFRSKLGMKSQRSYKLLVKIAQRFQLNLEWISDRSFKLSVNNWLELQENRGGKRSAKKEQNPTEERREKKDIRRKNKDILNQEIFAPAKPDANAQKPLGQFFKKQWAKRYGYEIPAWGLKENAQLKSWVGRVGQEKAEKFIEMYLSWNDPFVVRAGHPVCLMVERTNAFFTDAVKGREKLKDIKQHENFVRQEVEETTEEKARRVFGGQNESISKQQLGHG